MSSSTSTGRTSKRTVWTVLIVVCFVLGFAWAAVDNAAGAPPRQTSQSSVPWRICNPRPPEYPGCTYQQMRAIEAPDKPEMRRNYDKSRWDQTRGHEFPNISRANMRHLSHLYDRAAAKWVANQHAKGIFGKAAQPRFATWSQFYNNMDCGGSFGIYSSMAAAWCRITAPINAVAEGTKSLVIKCDGTFVGGAVVGAGIAWWGGITIAPGALAGGGTAAAGCVADNIWEKLTPW